VIKSPVAASLLAISLPGYALAQATVTGAPAGTASMPPAPGTPAPIPGMMPAPMAAGNKHHRTHMHKPTHHMHMHKPMAAPMAAPADAPK
jgi:hypothetical protein